MTTTYTIRNVAVEFPHKAYDCQLDYMDKVIGALQEKKNALLESPTGTGKTLCLLTAALAWRQVVLANQQISGGSSLTHIGAEVESIPKFVKSASLLNGALKDGIGMACERPPQIIYASRTHSQLSQVIGELGKTIYRPKLAVVGSREQMCINGTVQKVPSVSAQSALCSQLVKRQGCEYYVRAIEMAKQLGEDGSLFDIEDLLKFGKANRACPYFLSRENLVGAEIVFLPYNYLIDPKSRGLVINNLDLTGAVVIFDEAHNLENSCGDASSYDLSTDDIMGARREIETCIKIASSDLYSGACSIEDLGLLEDILKRLLDSIFAIPLNSDLQYSSQGAMIFELFKQSKIDFENFRSIMEKLDKAAKFYLDDQYRRTRSGTKSHLQTIESALKTIFRNSDQEFEVSSIDTTESRYFRLFISQDRINATDHAPIRILSYWCFNPGIAMRQLQKAGVRSIILTSGTLSPLQSFASELQLEFAYRLENCHVISDSQIFAAGLRDGPSGVRLNCSYNHRDRDAYKLELGKAIVRLIQIIPEGVLVFFPTYAVMEACLENWKLLDSASANSIWNRIMQIKTPFIEPRTKNDLVTVMSKFDHAIAIGRGAILFAVCRGKVSEGLDFADGKARGVIITGIPFPPLKDPKVVLKRQYLQDCSNNKLGSQFTRLSSDEWYSQQASRAVNQALGRVIRHQKDYGAIILLDERFCQPWTINQLSKWVRPHVETNHETFDSFISRLSQFFRQLQNFKACLQVDLNDYARENVSLPPTAAANLESTKRIFLNGTALLCNKEQADTTNSVKITKWLSKEETNRAVTNTALASNDKKLAKAQAFLLQISQCLPSEAGREFNILLRSYRTKQITLINLTTKLLQLFTKHHTLHLMDEFRDFVSPKHRDQYDEIILHYQTNLNRKVDNSISTNKDTDNKLEQQDNQTTLPHQSPSPLSNRKDQGPELKCPVCQSIPKKPFKSKCGHVCCFLCWSQRLNKCPECPVCRQRTRMSQLLKIYTL